MICPVCKADNEQSTNCRRCKADLSLLWTLESQREHLVRAAQACLHIGSGADAEHLASEADRLRAGADARRLQAAGRLLQRDFPGAVASYRSAAELSGN